jgi:hypothetical protein
MTRPQRFVISPGKRKGLEMNPNVGSTFFEGVDSDLDSGLISQDGRPDL